jgi:hypothetical protein
MQITYRASNLPGNHIDLMYACTTKYRTEVPILLKHALTCLSFKAILAEPSHDGAVVKVKSLKIKNVINKGTLTVDGNGNSSWALSTLQTDRRDYENITIDALRLINVTLNPNTPVDIIAPVSGNPNNVNFLMIPQPLTDILVEIGLDIDITKPDGSHEFHEEVNFFPVPDSHPWEMGKHITYIIHAARDLIYIGAQDEGWYRNTPDTMWDIEHQ